MAISDVLVFTETTLELRHNLKLSHSVIGRMCRNKCRLSSTRSCSMAICNSTEKNKFKTTKENVEVYVTFMSPGLGGGGEVTGPKGSSRNGEVAGTKGSSRNPLLSDWQLLVRTTQDSARDRKPRSCSPTHENTALSRPLSTAFLSQASATATQCTRRMFRKRTSIKCVPI